MTAKWNYWNGPDEEDRREVYAEDFKPEYQTNGDDVQRRISAVETAFRSETQVTLPEGYSSGWRPASVNESTSNAGKLSAHLTAEAGDRRDTPNGDFSWWCARHPEVLEQHGLYMEHPVATVIRAYASAREEGREATPWCHLSTRAPATHLRVYWPDKASLAEWDALLAAGGGEGITYTAWETVAAGARASEDEARPRARRPRRGDTNA